MHRGRRLLVGGFIALTTAYAGQRYVESPARADAVVDVAGLVVTKVLTDIPGFAVAARDTADGRIFVALKEGRVLMYDGPGDTTPVVTLDIHTDVMDYVDRGLLGIAVDPGFTTGRPYLYVLYTYNRDPFGPPTVPMWMMDDGSQGCPYPPGGGTDGCTVTARLDRYTIAADGTAIGPPLRLLDGADGAGGGWCSQFNSHSIGTVEFGADGMLYVGAGDGASYGGADFGQLGGTLQGTQTPANPCNDKQGTTPRTGGRGTALTASTSRGGAVRSQAARDTLANEYITWDGKILRIDPNTGAAAAGNPLIGNGIANDDRIVAYGLRNPYRFGFRPGTNTIWLGDVGYNAYEEVDTFPTGPGQSSVPNFGWPCYEGASHQSAYDALDIGLCESLYANGNAVLGTQPGVPSAYTPPVYTWSRYGSANGTAPLPCNTVNGGGAAVGGAFQQNPAWPTALHGAYVFGDYARQCLMAMPLGANGQPDPSRVTSLVSGAAPIDIRSGPGGDIYWIDAITGDLNRLRPLSGNLPPVASFTATPAYGATLPLNVTFDASATTDPNPGETLTYTWDLDGDGACDDGSGITINRSYPTAAVIAVTLCVTDQLLTDTATRSIEPGNSPPVIQSLTTSADGSGWKVGDTVDYAATATDDGGPLPASAYVWTVVLRHCDSVNGATCHTHPLQDLPTGPSGSFVTPDHEFYAFTELQLTVTDALGLSATRTVDVTPRLSNVTLQTSPPGLPVSAGGNSGASPFTQPFLEGGASQLIVPAVATSGGRQYVFAGWDDAPAAPNVRSVTAPAGGGVYTARYVGGGLVAVQPVRLMDTRTGTGVAAAGAIAGGTSVRLQVTGANGVAPGTTAVVIDVTAVDPVADGYVSVFPCGDVPAVSNLNVGAGATVANLATVPLDAQGGICIFTQQTTDLVVDLSAVATPSGDRFTAHAPIRAVDTRVTAQRLAPGEVRVVPLPSTAVAADASAVVATVTVTDPDAAGFLVAYPCGGPPPLASNLNFAAGQTVSNLVMTALGPQHSLCVMSSTATDLVVDVSGWLGTTVAEPLIDRPTRVFDTRIQSHRLTTGETLRLDAATLGTHWGATAVVANVTAVGASLPGYLTVFPCGAPVPLASNVNYAAAENRPVLAVSSLGADGSLCVYTSTAVDVVIDVQGWMIATP